MATKASTPVGITSEKSFKQIETKLQEYKANVIKKIDISAKTAVVQQAIKGTNSEAAFTKAAKQLDAKVEEYLGFVDEYIKIVQQQQEKYKKYDTGVAYDFVEKK